MIEIREALEAQAEVVRSAPDVADVRRRAGRRARRRNMVRGACAVLVVVLGAGTAVVLRLGGAGTADDARSITRIEPGARPPVALVLDGETGRLPESGRRGLERVDPTAEDGAWTVTVRRPDGSLGRNGAVVTFPAPAAVLENLVDVNGAAGGYADKLVVWPIGDSFARVRGDLDQATLLAVARATTIVNGRPVVGALSGLDLVVVQSAPYRAPSVRQMSYGSTEVGEGAALGNGPSYTAVLTGGGFEDQLYLRGTIDFVDVGGRKTVVSAVAGGNATMAWEPEPGVVALVGYSGSAFGGAAKEAMARLVLRTRPIDAATWAENVVQRSEQRNDFGG